jgi:zona occludens toxin
LDLVQVCYRVKKGTAFGSDTNYIRKVQDGVRGEVVNTSIRKYEKQYFPFYKSHTRGGGTELGANDIVPIWRRWPFIGAALMLIIFVGMLSSGMLKNPMNAKNYKGQVSEAAKKPGTEPDSNAVKPVQLVEGSGGVTGPNNQAQAMPVQEPEKIAEPFASNGVHIVGHISNKVKNLWILALSSNGQKMKNITANELMNVGYGFSPVGDCAAWITYKTIKRFITCDTPKQSIAKAM